MSDDQAVDPRHAPTERDGFRPRRKRPKGWMKQAIKDGVIPDLSAPAQQTPPPPGAQVIEAPVATLSGGGTE
jgi:hypothetical protein